MYRKYGNKITEIDGIKFHSQKEAKRYVLLSKLQEQGQISELKLQPRFDFKIDGKLMFFYKADFEYKDSSGDWIIEDVKGIRLPIFNLKKKIIEATHNIEITLI